MHVRELFREILFFVYRYTAFIQLLSKLFDSHHYYASQHTLAHRFFGRAIMVVHTRGVRCTGDMPRCIPCHFDVLEETSKHWSCIATDLGIESFLASNSDPWPVIGVWQVVE